MPPRRGRQSPLLRSEACARVTSSLRANTESRGISRQSRGLVDYRQTQRKETPMNAILFRIGIGGLALAMTLGHAGNVRAETLTYKVALKSASEVPPNASSGSGTADVT